MSTNKAFNLAEMSDDEINNFDPSQLKDEDVSKPNSPAADDGDEGKSAPSTAKAEDQTEGTGGAASEDGSGEADEGEADGASDNVMDGMGNADQSAATADSTKVDDQSTSAGSDNAADTGKPTQEVDYKSEFGKVMAPFKAAKREIRLTNIEDARRLMQMGVDYSRKMEAMKPHQRIIKTLEKAGLLDVGEINFLIDLKKKNPEAIKKFLKDSEIDPMDLSLEGDTPYKPTNHTIGDSELVLDEVLDEIRGTEAFTRTVEVITNEWDTASRRVLMDNPAVIRILNDHVAAGIYDQIASKVAEERVFGRLTGLSDLEAYKAVGDAIQKSGGFNKPNSKGPSTNGNTNQDSSQDSGSGSASAENLRNRKRAASPTKGSASTGKPVIDIMGMSDEEILKINPRSL